MSNTPETISISQAQSPFYWGIDIGGTGIKIGLVDDIGQTMAFDRLPTRESEGPTAAMQRVADVIGSIEQQLGISDKIARVGLGAPGPMDLPRGYLVAPPQLPSWWDFPLRETVSKMLGHSVSFLNDANAAAYGEFWLGSGRNDTSMILLTLGTGVGGGIIVEGELVNGVNSFGSECGHIIVDSSPTAELCVWGGGRGQLEAYASASGVVSAHPPTVDRGSGQFAERIAGWRRFRTDGQKSLLRPRSMATPWLWKSSTIRLAGWASESRRLVHTLDPGSVVLGRSDGFWRRGLPDRSAFSGQNSSTNFEFAPSRTSLQERQSRLLRLGADAGYLGVAGYARKEAIQA